MARGGKREGAGRPAGAITKRTREVAERALATGMSPLDVMLDNMRHFQQVALDAEATLEGLTAEEFSQVSPSASPEDQFKFLLAQVKKTAGFRQMAQDAARDAAPYVHPKLASVEHSGPNGGPIKLNILPEDAEL
ncbi:hypothetical protein GOB20_24585 [Sinorhizobium meliloti]|nr:hypothetical protein [Sinorhizobium meliloti]